MLWKYKKCYQETNEDSQPPLEGCYSFLITATVPPGYRFTYNDCLGKLQNIHVLFENPQSVCALFPGPISIAPASRWDVEFNGDCPQITP